MSGRYEKRTSFLGTGAEPDDPVKCKFFVGGLPKECEDQQFYEAFVIHGEVVKCHVNTDSDGRTRGFGFVTYKNAPPEGFENQTHTVLGKSVTVRPSVPNDTPAVQPGKKLFLGKLPPDLEDEQVKEVFSQFGTVEDAFVVRDAGDRISRGFGFVEFSTHEEAQGALDNFDGKLGGKEIAINWPQKPQRRGGGFRERSAENNQRGRGRGGNWGGRGGGRFNDGYGNGQQGGQWNNWQQQQSAAAWGQGGGGGGSGYAPTSPPQQQQHQQGGYNTGNGYGYGQQQPAYQYGGGGGYADQNGATWGQAAPQGGNWQPVSQHQHQPQQHQQYPQYQHQHQHQQQPGGPQRMNRYSGQQHTPY